MAPSTPSATASGAGPATPPAVSLPKGGGAIRGIGEKFGANPVTGTGSITVPVEASAGRSGFGPSLALEYDSGAGNGIFGVGWSVSLPAITRRTDRGVPRYAQDPADTFLLSGAEDLVEYRGRTAGGWQPEPEPRQEAGIDYAVRRFRPRTEGLFARIEQWTETAAGDVHWRSVTRDNVTSVYGRDHASRLVDPADPHRTFSWLISESYDDRGNAIQYAYKAEDDAGVDLAAPHETGRPPRNRTAQRHIKAIRYGNRVPRPAGPAAPATDWMFEVVFDYGEHDLLRPTPVEQSTWAVREDPFSTYRAGFELRTYRRCQRILMFHHFPGESAVGQDCLVRSTELAHRPDPVGSLLASVTHAGFRRLPDGSYVRGEVPPVEFDYTAAAVDDQVRELAPDSVHTLPAGVDGDRWRWIDLDGEGLPGVLAELPGAWYYTPNLGGGRLGPTAVVPGVPRTSGRSSFLDLAGDGQLDLVDLAGAVPGFFERTPERGWDPFRPFRSRPVVDLDAPRHHQVDLTGDGHADLLTAQGDVVEWFPSMAEDGFAAALRVAAAFEDGSAPLADAPPSIATYFADMSGDGLPDVVRIGNGEIAYWPSLGHGRFGAKVTMDSAPVFDEPDQFDTARLRIADIDGSGTTDLVYLHRDSARLYANRSGNGWGQAQVLGSGFPDASSTAGVEVLDLLGNGTACLVLSSPLARDRAAPMRYIDLMGGQKPHLLVGVRNNLGAETVIRYAPSTRFYLDDQASGRPWATRLPFPVHVVEQVETRDLITSNVLTTRYAYHHGFYDGVEREFRGFSMVEQWDTEVLDAVAPAANADPAHSVPPSLTRTWFHTGAPGDAEVTRGLEGEYYAGDVTAAGSAALALLDDTVLPTSVRSAGATTPLRLSAEEEREARRALKGSLLRQEVYGRDGSSAEGRPYVVAEHNYTVEMLQPAIGGDHAVFFVHPRETLTAHHERAVHPVGGTDLHDPRVVHELALEADEYGNVTRSASIAYGRRHDDPDPRLSAADRKAQATTHLVVTESSYTNAVTSDDAYRTPLPSETSTWEVTGLVPDLQVPDATDLFGFDELAGKLAAVATELPYREWRVDAATLPAPVRRLVERIRTRYRENSLTAALPLGALQSRALPFEEYRLALTDALVTDLYGADVDQADLTAAGFVPEDGGWWVPSGRVHYSATAIGAAAELAEATAHFFLPRRFVDPFGAATVVDYEDDLLVAATRDALLNETAVDNDLRVLQPVAVVDPNGNRSQVAFDALGMVVATAVMGKAGQDTGDRVDAAGADLDDATRDAFFAAADPFGAAPALLGAATVFLIHDLFAFMRSSAAGAPPEPPAVATIARETHGVGGPPRIQLSFAYSDGFGREIQRKTRAEPGPAGETRWVGTGWTIVNNKGKPVRTYEPFFSSTHRCELDLTVGVSTITFYDPLDRVVATIRPDGTWEKQVIGTWRQSAWDANDTVLDDPGLDPDIGGVVAAYLAAHGPWNSWRDQRSGAVPGSADAEVVAKTDAHARTPGMTFTDPLGRAFLAIEHDRLAGTDTFYVTRTVLDVEGNQREIVDARGRLVMRHDVDMLATLVRRSSMEAGERRELHDVAGQVVIGWGSRGFRRRIEFDELRRPVRVFVQGGGLAGEIVEQEIEYGDHQQADDRNLRTRVRQQRDGAGVLTNLGFDAQGNLLGARRELAAEYAAALDWFGAVSLTGESFLAETEFDALSRPTLLRAPDGTRIRPAYNEAGLLDSIDATLPDGRVVAVVRNIDYDAQGRRTRCDHGNLGNETTTVYTYDRLTFRMTTLQTTRGPDRLQDLAFTYDPVGNITRITDAAQQTVFFRNRLVDPRCEYTYDAVYRLVEATGREHLGQMGAAPVPPSQTDAPRTGLPHPGDGNAMGRYTQRYAYDEVGNLLRMAHEGTDPVHPGWTVPYTYLEPSQLDPSQVSNRLTSAFGPGVLTYDEHGNTTSMPELPGMSWNHLDQLSSTARQAVNNGVPETTYNAYDAAGERIRKVTERANAAGSRGARMSERIYLGGFEVHRRFAGDGTTVQLERLTTHVMDGTSRVALIERRTVGADGSPPTLVRFQLGNHLGSVCLELDEGAQIISYEEYYPYGSTSYQAVRSQTEAPKRYRYTSKERDEESGLSYHSARYYISWLGRWLSTDPIDIADGPNTYLYVGASPIRLTDQSGHQGDDPFLEYEYQRKRPIADRLPEGMDQGHWFPHDKIRKYFPKYSYSASEFFREKVAGINKKSGGSGPVHGTVDAAIRRVIDRTVSSLEKVGIKGPRAVIRVVKNIESEWMKVGYTEDGARRRSINAVRTIGAAERSPTPAPGQQGNASKKLPGGSGTKVGSYFADVGSLAESIREAQGMNDLGLRDAAKEGLFPLAVVVVSDAYRGAQMTASAITTLPTRVTSDEYILWPPTQMQWWHNRFHSDDVNLFDPRRVSISELREYETARRNVAKRNAGTLGRIDPNRVRIQF